MHAPSLLQSAALLTTIFVCSPTGIEAKTPCETVTPVFGQALPNVPGQSLSGLLVIYPPGCKSVAHHHAGAVMAFVLTGQIRSENSATGPTRTYSVGESFFEPPGSHHMVSENASATESASLLAIFVAETGAALKTDD